MINNFFRNSASFKDPDAFVFQKDGKIYRKISASYKPIYQKFISCGLYNALLDKNLIIPHQEVSLEEDCIILKPEEVFISYPWEWSFCNGKMRL